MDAVFEVRHGADGHVWRVYADGRIEGFPEGCVVVNRVPLYAMEVAGPGPLEADLRALDAIAASQRAAREQFEALQLSPRERSVFGRLPQALRSGWRTLRGAAER